MSIYKKFTAQDIAVVPFNAHKQYDFTSGSASTNSIKHFNLSWTSESIDIYSSGSTTSYGLPADSINTIKYYQTDHLFYKNFKKDIGNRFGNKHYLNQKRDLYEKTNILSIPTGLYGHEIKPGTFYLTSSKYEVVDDSKGNLIISGTNVNNYPIDIRSNLFRLDPIKAFKRYDLNTFDEYHNEVFYLDGEKRVNKIPHYSSIDAGEFDDSYYFNPIKYENIHFATSSLGSDNCKFGSIGLDTFNSSRIVSPDNEVFNFNSEDDFAVSFNMEVVPYAATLNDGLVSPPDVGQIIHDGIVFHVDGDEAYLVVSADPSTIAEGYVQSHDTLSTISSATDSDGLSNLTNGAEANEGRIAAVNLLAGSYITVGGNSFGSIASPVTASNFTLLNGENSSGNTQLLFGTPEFLTSANTGGPQTEPFIGGGLINTQNLFTHINLQGGSVLDAPLFNYVRNGGIPQQRLDTWIANYDEVNLINQTLGFTNSIRDAKSKGRIYLATNDIVNQNVFNDFDNSLSNQRFNIITSNFVATAAGITTPVVAMGELGIKSGNLEVYFYTEPDSTIDSRNLLIIRKINWRELDHSKRYILTKSTTKTVVPSPTEGQAQILKTSTSGALQPKDVQAEPQFPFSIYHISNSLYFERSDGEATTIVSGEITGSIINQRNAIICEKTGSTMNIIVNGSQIATSTDTTNQTQNSANVYIGSKGNDSLSENLYLNGINYNLHNLSGSDRYFNGYLGNINIYDKSYPQTVYQNISESINHSPYIGNIFYQNGFVTITHPKYQDILSGSSGKGIIERLKFQGSHLIYENEYQCTIGEEEFNDTLNISARKIRSHQSEDLANFATGSLFKPYITTVGLYNEDNELLVVGKLGQPLRISDETDSTIVIRWDT